MCLHHSCLGNWTDINTYYTLITYKIKVFVKFFYYTRNSFNNGYTVGIKLKNNNEIT